MKRLFILALIALTAVAYSHGQIVYSGNPVLATTQKSETYVKPLIHRINFSYAGLFYSPSYNHDYGNYESTSQHGFGVDYRLNAALLKSHPLYLYTGINMNWHFGGFGNQKSGLHWDMVVPVGVSYRIALSPANNIYLSPFAGIALKINTLQTDEDGNEFSSSRYYSDADCWNIAQFSGQVGLYLDMGPVTFGFQYMGDFTHRFHQELGSNNYLNLNTHNINAILGFNF